MNLLLEEGLWGYGSQSYRFYRDFKSGDRVILTQSIRSKDNVGATGTIIAGDGTYFIVNWDQEYQGLSSTVGISPSRIDLLNSGKKRQN